jgi:glycosyltransferase involved in cell wall biosynthesis
VNWGGTHAGGGRTYLVGFIEELLANGSRDIAWEFIARPAAAEAIKRRDAAGDWSHAIRAAPLRAVWEQVVLPVRARRVDVLISAANFGPVILGRRHIVVAQNALYFSSAAGKPTGVRFALESRLARACVARAGVTVVSSNAMRRDVAAHTRTMPRTIPFGPGLVESVSPRKNGPFIFLHPTPYAPHKNFTAILRAVAEVAADRPGEFVVHSACDPTTPFARRFKQSAIDRDLLADPVIAKHVKHYSTGVDLHRTIDADAVVIASETESFCFPLAESMAVGLPLIVADAPFAREMCGEGAIFADPTEPGAFASAMRAVLDGKAPAVDSEAVSRLSWRSHVDGIAQLCLELGRS